jgi:hypothetical protein
MRSYLYKKKERKDTKETQQTEHPQGYKVRGEKARRRRVRQNK